LCIEVTAYDGFDPIFVLLFDEKGEIVDDGFEVVVL
jgi:hypothetical protein